MTMIYIYGLKEVDSDEIRYVGKTVDPDMRLNSHRSSARGDSGHPKEQWIASSTEITMITLETCTQKEWREREKYWVDHYIEKGHRLTNVLLVNGLNGHSQQNRSESKIAISVDELTMKILDEIAPELWPDLTGNRSAILRKIMDEWHVDIGIERRMLALESEIAELRQMLQEMRDAERNDHDHA